MFVGTISNRALGLPSHVILAGKMTQMKFAGVVFGGNEFHRRIVRLFRNAAVVGWTETKLKNLRVGVIDGSAKMHGVSGADRNEENVRKDERVRRLEGYIITGKNSLFLDSCPIGLDDELKFDFVQLLIVKRHVIL